MLRAWRQILDGATFDGYKLKDFIAHGNFGLVYEGEGPNGAVAIKCLIPNAEASVQLEFENEGLLLSRLASSSNVVNFVESGQRNVPVRTEAGVPLPIPVKYHVLELASAGLEELLIESQVRENLLWSERFTLWRGIVRGVHQMHLKHVVHRDLKASNCLIFVGGGKRRGSDCKVADLGRAKYLSIGPSYDPIDYVQGMGDLRFAPPEYLWAAGTWTPDAHKSADLYGLGSALFEIATGVGLTSFAMGTRETVMKEVLTDRRAGIGYDSKALRPRFNLAFEVFGETLPAPVRTRAVKLMAALCDPDPESRSTTSTSRARRSNSTPFEELFREIDILIRTCVIGERSARNKIGGAA